MNQMNDPTRREINNVGQNVKQHDTTLKQRNHGEKT